MPIPILILLHAFIFFKCMKDIRITKIHVILPSVLNVIVVKNTLSIYQLKSVAVKKPLVFTSLHFGIICSY